jgi:MFS transporter, DHA1 family, tetracycline resistance protein
MSKQETRKAFIILFCVVATELIGFGLIIPVLPQIAKKFSLSGTSLGILLAAYSFAQFIANPILGSLSDRYGRRPILILSKLGTCIAYIIMANAFSYYGLLVARLLDGFTGGNISVARAYIADITSPENRAKGMAVIGIAFGTGFIIGPGIGGLIYASSSSHSMAAYIAGSLSLIATLLTLFFLKESKDFSKEETSDSDKEHTQTATPLLHRLWGLSRLVSTKIIGIILATQFIFMSIFSGFETSFSVFTETIFGYTETENSLLFFYVGILALLIQGGITRKAFRNLSLGVSIGLGITAVSLYGLSLSNTLPRLGVSLALLSLGIALVNTHLPALLSIHSDDKKAGKVMGIYESIGSLSRIIGPLLIYISFFNNLGLAYQCYAIILTLSILGVTQINRQQKDA